VKESQIDQYSRFRQVYPAVAPRKNKAIHGKSHNGSRSNHETTQDGKFYAKSGVLSGITKPAFT